MPDVVTELVTRVEAQVGRPLGYKRAGLRLRKDLGDVLGVAWYQKSRANEGESIKFTVNVEMSVPALSASSRSSEAHWTDRLGFLLPAESDVWWTVTHETLDAVVAEHVAAFRDVVDPHLRRSASLEWLIEE